jgi:hypothetical protein
MVILCGSYFKIPSCHVTVPVLSVWDETAPNDPLICNEFARAGLTRIFILRQHQY